jgi:hypothetical protein
MRTLKRPMFRMGGSANEGITSGLDKPKRGLVNEPGSYAGKDIMDYVPEIEKYMESRRPKETYKDRDDFLINLGLDMVSRSPSSNIISTIGESAKGPFKQYQAGQAQKRKTQAEGESDLFNTLIGAQAKTLGSESAGKGWLKQWEFEQIPVLNKKIQELGEKEKLGTISPEESLELQNARNQKSEIVQLDDITSNVIKNNKYLFDDEKDRLFNADQQSDSPKYKNKKDLQLEIDALKSLKQRFGAADGGRAGYKRGMAVVQDDERTNYQNGMTAMPAAGDMMQATGDMGPQDDSAPEELTNELTFEELRQRLPQEIGDDIINLILSSAEAMEDFATIQTEDDISTFNKKYGVNLVLPSEG